jgi:alkylation response protein AidB-like acyl-CoA dehydrogenase
MDLSWTSEQLAFRERVVAFARESLNENVPERDAEATFSQELWQACGDYGVPGWHIPEELGGSGFDLMTALLGMEAIGYGSTDNGLTLGLNAHMWTVGLPLLEFGSEELKQRFLPGMSKGSLIGAHALTESEAGSDAFSLETHAEKKDDGYVLNGVKSLVTLGPVADLYLVFATVRPGSRMWGITAFVVERDRDGVTVGEPIDKMGMRTVPLSAVEFKDCFVPAENRLGADGSGAAMLRKILEWDHCFLLATHVGTMERVLEKAVEFARDREQFGQSIGKFQAVSHRLADMKVQLESARWLVYRAAWLLDRREPAALEAAMAKLVVSEAFVQIAVDGVRTFGGRGYLTEHGMEKEVRDAVGGLLYAGTSDIQRNLIARLVGL